MKLAHRLIARQLAQRTLADHQALHESKFTRVSTSARPWWHRAGAGALACLLWFSPIAVTPQRAALDAGVLAAGKTFIPFWRHILPVRVTIGIAQAQAAPIVDPNAPIQFQPKITQSTGANGGVPVVNITAPNGAGISLNKYQSFNVDAVGLILNNSLVTGTSLSGGTVQGNTNLSGRTASVILNEVTSQGSGYASVLNGPLEVFGAPATVIIANPNGISVRGASFTNTIGVTLSTGIPQFLSAPNGTASAFDSATAIGYNVTGGHIQIDGNPTASGPAAGIEGTVGNIDLIGETVGINAPLYVGNTINVIAGRQFVMPTAVTAVGNTYATSTNGADNSAASINGANANANNGYAIDATAFGAVTAGQIQVVSTAAGMGVRVDSQLAANAGDVTIAANGDLSVAGTNAYQQVELQANGNLTMTGTHQGTGGVVASAGGDLNATGLIQSGAALSATAGGNLTLASAQSKGDMTLAASSGNVAINDTTNSDGALQISSGGTTSVNAQVTSQKGVSVQASSDVAIAGSLTSGTTLNVTTQGNLSVAGSLLAGTDAVLNAAGGIDVAGLFLTQGNASVQTGRSLTSSGSIAIGQAALIAAAQDIVITGKLLSNDLSLNAGNNVSLAAVQAGGHVQIQARGLDGTGDVTLNGDTATLGATSIAAARNVAVNGALAGGSSVSLNAQNSVSVASSASVQSVGDMTIAAATGSVSSTGALTSAGALTVSAAQDVSATGATNAVGAVTINAGRDLTLGGSVGGQANGTLQAGRDLTTQGTVGFVQNASLSSGRDVNVGGLLQAGDIAINAANSATLNNVQASGSLHVQASGTAGGGDIAVNGTFISTGASNLDASRDVSIAGSMSAIGTLAANAGRNVNVTGSATGAGTLSLSATSGSVTSSGALTSTGYLNLNAGQDIALTGSGSTINNATLAAGNDITLGGSLVGGADATMTAGHDINGSGTSAFNGVFTLSAGNDIAHTGALQASTLNATAANDASLHDVQTASTLTVTANGAAGQGDVSLTGTVNSAGNITTTSARDTNLSGTVATGAGLQSAAQGNINITGTTQTAGDAALTTRSGDVNLNGTVAIGGNAALSSGRDVTLGGTVTIADGTQVNAARDVALTGTVNTQGSGSIAAGRDLIGNGSAAFAQGLATTSGRDTTLGGLLQAASVDVQAGNNATLGDVESTSTIHLAALGNAGGGNLTVNGTAGAAGAISTNAAADTSIAGKLASGSTLSVNTQGNLFVAGAIEAYGDTTLQAVQGSLSATGGINSGGALAITTGLDLLLGASTTSVSDMTLSAGRDAILNGVTVGNAGGSINAGRDITGAGTQAFTNDVSVTAQRNVNLTGTLQANRVDVTGGNDASVGSVASQTTLTVTAQGNAGGGDAGVTGTVIVPGAVTLTGARDVNVSGTVSSGDALALNAQRNVSVTGGIESVGDLSVSATTGNANLTGTTTTNGALTVTAGTDAQLGGQVSASKDITAQAGHDLQLTGTIAGQGAGTLTAANDIYGSGVVALAGQANVTAAHDVALTGALQASTATVTGGNNAGLGSVQATNGPISVIAQGAAGQGDVTFGGTVATTGALNVQAARDIGIGGASTVGGTTTLAAGRGVALGGDLNSVGDVTITGTTGGITGAAITTQGNVTANAAQSIALTGALTVGGITSLTAGNDLSIGSLNTAGAATLQAQGLSGTGDINVAGDLRAGGALTANAARDIGIGGATASLGAVSLTAGRNLAAAGALASNAQTTLSATTGNLSVGGAIQSVGDLDATSGGNLSIAGGMVNGQINLTAQGGMTLTNALLGGQGASLVSGALLGGGGALVVQNDISIQSGGGIALGEIETGGKLTATSVSNASFGQTLAIGAISVTSQSGGVAFNGSVTTGGNLALNAAQDISATGGTSTVGTTTIASTNGNVTVAGTASNGDATVSAGKTLTVSGTSTVAGNVALTGQNITLSGSLRGAKDVTASATGAFDASAASLIVTNSATFSGATLSLGNLMVGGALNASGTSSLSLSGSQMFVVGAANFTTQGAFTNTGSLLAQSVSIQSGSFVNAANASLASTTATGIATSSFTNAGLISGQDTTVTASSLNNTGGTLIGVNSLSVTTGSFNNTNGIVAAGDPSGTNTTSGNLSLTVTGSGSVYTNTGGQLLAQKDLQLGANNAAVDVSQGSISQGGALSITAGSIAVSGTWNYGGQSVALTGLNGITNTGTMTGTAALSVSTGGTFANSGQVISQDLTLNGALSNAAGALFHATDTLTLNGSVTNRGTVEASILNVNSGYYDNQLGLTQSVGAMTFAMGGGTLQNTGGQIFAGTNLTINAGAVINDQTAPTGGITTTTQVSDPSLLMSAVIGTENIQWSQRTGNNFYTPNVTNSTATLGDLLSPTGTTMGWLIGSNCVEQCSETASAPTAQSGSVAFTQSLVETSESYNGSGIYQQMWMVGTSGTGATSAFTLPNVYQTTTTQQQGTSGVISAGGSITLTANTLSNRGGQISAQGNIALNVQSLQNGAAAPTLTQQTTIYVDQAQFSAFLAQLSAMGPIAVKGTGNPTGNYCDSSGCVTYTATAPITFTLNTGATAPSATGTTTVSGATGMIAAGSNLSVAGGNLVNGGLLYAGNNVTVSAQSLTNQGGNSQNHSSQAGCANGVPNTACGNGGQSQGGNPSSNNFGYSQSDATIFAGNDLVIAAGNVNNTYGNLIAGHDLVVGGVGTTATSSTPAQSLTNTSGNIIAGNDITLNVSGAITNTLPPPTLVHENFGATEQYSGCMTAGGYKNGYCEAYVEQQSGSSSTISAGNSLSIQAGTLTNIGSLITAGTSATINVQGPIVNSAQALNAYWHSHWTQETGLFSSDQTHDAWACGSAAECAQIYGSAYTGGSIDPPTPVGNIAATIQAPNLNITSGGQIQNVGNVIGTQVSLTGQKLINGITTANTYTPTVGAPSQVISISPLTMPGLNISIPRSGNAALPTSTNGQAVYVDGQLAGNDIGPQDLLNNLPANLKPSSTVFYYNPQEEDALLQQAALQQTGKASFINGLTYDDSQNLSVTEQEKAILYQNAINYANTNDLQVGTALTQTQINELTQPMLWYVEQTVPDPQCTATGVSACPTITALMPQIYLPSGTAAVSAGGNIEGTDVTLNFGKGSGGSIENTGNISASDTLTVNTDSLTNEANQVNVGDIWNSVKGGYTNTTGTVVQPGGYMSAANLDLNVQTLAQIGGALQKLNTDGTVDQAGTAQLIASLQQQLGGDFTQTSLTDDLHTDFVKQGGSFGALQMIALVAAVVISIVTYGAASASIGAVAGATDAAASAGTAAAAAGASASAAATAAAEAGGTLMAATAGASAGLANIALSAGIAGMASSMTSQLISTGSINWGDVGKAGLVGALTAGLTNGITYNASNGLGFTMGATTAADPSIASLGGIQAVGNGMVPQAGVAAGNLPTAIAAMGAEAVIQAGVGTVIDGGSFLNALKGSTVSDLAASEAFAIGNGTDPLTLQNIAAHALLGCAAGAAEGNGCAGGAIGGATSASLTPFILAGVDQNGTPLTPELSAVATALAMLVGGGVAGALGQNASVAATWAENESLNNDQLHIQKALAAVSAFWQNAQALVPGGHMANQALEQAKAGNYSMAAALTVGSLADAGVGIITLGDAALAEQATSKITATLGDSALFGGTGSTAASTLAANKLAGALAEEQIAGGITNQGFAVQTQVSLTTGSTRAVADLAVTGVPNATVQVPAGYLAEDLSGNALMDASGNPITTFNLNSQGQAIVEVKTGNASLTSNQAKVYPAVQSGLASGTGAGTNAAKVGMSGPLPETPVIVLRKL